MSFCTNEKIAEITFKLIANLKKFLYTTPILILLGGLGYLTISYFDELKSYILYTAIFVTGLLLLLVFIISLVYCIGFFNELVYKYYIRKYGVCKPLVLWLLGLSYISSTSYCSINYLLNNYALWNQCLNILNSNPIYAFLITAFIAIIFFVAIVFLHITTNLILLFLNETNYSTFLFSYLTGDKFYELLNIFGENNEFSETHNYIKYYMKFTSDKRLIIIPENKKTLYENIIDVQRNYVFQNIESSLVEINKYIIEYNIKFKL